MPDLLIELFSEEIPARMQRRAAEDFRKLMTDGMVDAGLTYASAAAFSTPSRLALTVEGLLAASPATVEDRKGPRADAPDKAIEGFLRGAGVTRDALETRDTPKGPVLFARIEKPGRPGAAIVAEVLDQTIRGFPWPKSMRWGTGSLRWVRPLHGILCILTDETGSEIVTLDVDGIASGDSTTGHRFMAPAPFSVSGFEDYAAKLKQAFVVLDPKEREDTIWHDATNQAFANGFEVVEDPGLLAEVAGLVEWPVVLMGRIGAEFLDLPPEVLQSSMREHQKFFSVRNTQSGRIERFVTVANRDAADQGALMLAGYEKVLAARLADAKFFWENDLRAAQDGLDPWIDALGKVTFHNKLGSQADRIGRIAALARELAPITSADPDRAEEAARYAKADLSSEMVYEFPELQGVMGRYYLEAAGKDSAVAAAAQEHYAPLGPSDAVPTAPVSVTVALADKLDTLTGFWAIDEKPTGSKDPFALRRAALGVIRLVLEQNLEMHLEGIIFEHITPMFDGGFARQVVCNVEDDAALLEIYETIGEKIPPVDPDAMNPIAAGNWSPLMATKLGDLRAFVLVAKEIIRLEEEVVADLLSFFHDRLKVYLRDEGVRHDVIDACIAMDGSDDLALLVKRARALSAALNTENGENLVQGFKRANNILSQAEEADGVEYSYGADAKFAETEEERALFSALDAAEPKIAAAMNAQDFSAAMSAMAGLRGPIDAFFDAVQINTDNQTVRRNRLNLLSRIRSLCLSVADLTRLEG